MKKTLVFTALSLYLAHLISMQDDALKLDSETPIFEKEMERQRKQGIELRERKQREEEQAKLSEISADAPVKRGRPVGSKNKDITDALKDLSPKRQAYALLRASGENRRQAALKAGYSLSVANQPGRKIETEDYRRAFEQYMRKKIQAKKIVKRINEGLDAVETKFASQNGKFTDHRDVIDYNNRRKYAALAAQMTGAWTPKTELDHTQKIDADTMRRLLDISDKLGLSSLPPERLAELETSHVPLAPTVIDGDCS